MIKGKSIVRAARIRFIACAAIVPIAGLVPAAHAAGPPETSVPIAGFAPAAHTAGPPETSVSFGAEYSRGGYGFSQATSIAYFPVTLKYDADRYAMSLTLPYLFVTGPGNVVVAGGVGIPGGPSGNGSSGNGPPPCVPPPCSPGQTSPTRTASGLGDILLKGSVNLQMQDMNRPRLDLTAKAKLGTADRNLGTGENDYSVQLDVERSFGANNLFGSLGYKIMGEPPGVDYNNVAYGAIGGSARLSGTASGGLVLDAQEPVLAGVAPLRTLTLFLSNKIDAKTRVTPYVLKGWGNGSPDWGVGIALKLIQ
jgi:hypothetical protein